jgi:hypothetical protein
MHALHAQTPVGHLRRMQCQGHLDTVFGSAICAGDQDLLTILTPVYPDEHTLSLLRNQLRTFAAFADIASFAAWVMVTPAAKITTLQMFLDFELALLPPELSDKVRHAAEALTPLQHLHGWPHPELQCRALWTSHSCMAAGSKVSTSAGNDGDDKGLTVMTLHHRSCW